METKRLDLSKSTFMANGVKYKVSGTMSIDRFMEFERLQAHVGFGIDFKAMYDKLKEAYKHLNENKLADAAVMVHNLLNGVAHSLDKREHPMLTMCALFINFEDEDTGKFDEDVVQKKIDDWRAEGYAIEDFFQLAFNFVDGFIPAYNEIIQSISERAEESIVKSTGKTA